MDVYDESIRFGRPDAEEARANPNSLFAENAIFGVYGIETTDPATITQIFNNEPVFYRGGKWDYINTRYWELDRTYKFRAFYPYTNQEAANVKYIISLPMGETVAEECRIDNFVVSDSVDGQVDLMLSDVERHGPYRSFSQLSPVSFTFHHLLTKVNLRLKADKFGDNTIISRMRASMFGMKSKGNYSCTSATQCQWDTENELVNNVGYSIMHGDSKSDVFADKPDGLLAWEKGLLMIPQPLENMRIKVEFVLKSGETSNIVEETFVVPNTTPWLPGKQITYGVTLKPDLTIKFLAPQVDTWSVSKSSNSIIIK